ncbi:MAG: ADP-ribosylglycohydrolase [Myxococcota bacterium]|jgi:ADP-ribosylglycohydrolase
MTDAPDRVSGILLGLAAGDRNGGPTELALRLAESLTTQQGFSPDDVSARYRQWWRVEGFDTGPVADAVFALVDDGMSHADAAAEVHRARGGLTAGSNTAHRCPPLAMCATLTDDDLPAVAVREAALTHFHPLAGETSAAVVVLIRALVQGASLSGAIDRAAVGRCAHIEDALHDALPLSRGGFAPEVLGTALHFLRRHDGADLDAALQAALDHAGPANFAPVLVGAIGGARWGAAVIGGAHRRHVADWRRLERAAAALAAGWY